MEIVKREDILDEEYQLIFDVESHHGHEVVRDDHGVFRWKKNEDVNELVDASDLNEIIIALNRNGHGKNSEVYRKLYRNMGYSLYGYWEVFYWKVNNPEAELYRMAQMAERYNKGE